MGKLQDIDTSNKHSSTRNNQMKSTINHYISNYMDATNDYSKFFESAPNFVNYYAIDQLSSTLDKNLGSNLESIGNESPLRFNKIKNFPIFAVDEVNPTYDFQDDTGIDGTMEGQAVILPNTIQPQPGDYIIFTYHENDIAHLRAYRVNNINESSINSKTFYQISYQEETGTDISLLDHKLLNKVYETNYNNIGTENIAILPEEQYLFLEDIGSAITSIIKEYSDAFWDRKMNLFLIKYGNGYLYDPCLHQFINKFGIFSDSNSYLSDIYVTDLMSVSRNQYKLSIYNKFVNYDILKTLTTNYSIFDIANNAYFELYPYNFQQIFYNINATNSIGTNIFEHDIDELANDYINKNSLSGIPFFESFFIRYIKTKYKEIDTTDIDKILSYVENKVLDIHDYILLPIILFMLEDIYNTINSNKGASIYE